MDGRRRWLSEGDCFGLIVAVAESSPTLIPSNLSSNPVLPESKVSSTAPSLLSASPPFIFSSVSLSFLRISSLPLTTLPRLFVLIISIPSLDPGLRIRACGLRFRCSVPSSSSSSSPDSPQSWRLFSSDFLFARMASLDRCLRGVMVP